MDTATHIYSDCCPYPPRSVLLHEPWPHGDHICVHVYIDVFHERQVVMLADEFGIVVPPADVLLV
jgi:hypothetical protein